MHSFYYFLFEGISDYTVENGRNGRKLTFDCILEMEKYKNRSILILCRKKKYLSRVDKNNMGGTKYKIIFSSLPITIQFCNSFMIKKVQQLLIYS